MARESSAGAVIFRREGKGIVYLLLHYPDGHWDFPKGNIEEGEDDHATVRREVREETGIGSIDFVKGFQETIRYSYKWNAMTVHKTVQIYLAETKESAVTLSSEHEGYAWLPYEEANERLTHDKGKNVLRLSHAALTGQPL